MCSVCFFFEIIKPMIFRGISLFNKILRLRFLVSLGMTLFPVVSLAQVEIFGLRTYANDDEYRPPVILVSESITIEFDVTTSQPPNVQIIFKHASKDWKIDENLFVNDPAKIRAMSLFYSVAPNGVYHYTYRYKNSFPNNKNHVEFLYSGNYIYTIVDRNDGDKILANGKFIVAEALAATSMTVENKFHPSYDSPMNEMNFISVTVDVPQENLGSITSINHSDVKTVDIIKNWDFEQTNRIEVDDNSAETFVENFYKPTKTFWKRDVAAGNEYRKLDLSSTAFYPNNKPVILKNNPDVSRFQWQGKADANGASKLKPFTGANSDYLEVEMRLRLIDQPRKKIFLVGGFSDWMVLPEFEMKQDEVTKLFKMNIWLRRGVYDYQYVLGDIDSDGKVINQEWLALEGNDWRTVNRFTAVVYYYDRQFGGFDRVIGYVRGKSPGTREVGKKTTSVFPVPPAAPMPEPVFYQNTRK